MNRFEEAIRSVPDIADGFKNGLNALGVDSQYVSATNPRLFNGSVNIDICTRAIYPNDSRWDYVLSYNGKAVFIEVHPATGGQVKEVEAKRNWLLSWLKEKATTLNKYPAGVPRFVWIHSGSYGLLKDSSEYKRAAMLGLIPKKSLHFK